MLKIVDVNIFYCVPIEREIIFFHYCFSKSLMNVWTEDDWLLFFLTTKFVTVDRQSSPRILHIRYWLHTRSLLSAALEFTRG